MSHVYFIQAASGPIKIGCAINIESRMRSLQIGIYEPLKLLGYAAGTHRHEGRIHHEFAYLRLRGEWYRPAQTLLQFIEDVKIHGIQLPPLRPGPEWKLGKRPYERIRPLCAAGRHHLDPLDQAPDGGCGPCNREYIVYCTNGHKLVCRYCVSSNKAYRDSKNKSQETLNVPLR